MRRLATVLLLTLGCAALGTGVFAAPFASAFADGGAPAPAAPIAPPADAPAAPAGPVIPDVAKALAARCRYEPAKADFTVSEPTKFGEKAFVESISFPSPVKSADPEKNDVVRARLFRTEKPEPAAVIVLGGWRFDPMSPQLAGALAAETGLQCLFVELPFQGMRTPKGRTPGELTFSADVEQNEATLVQAAQDIARAVDWLVEERKVDRSRIGIMGTSLGGFVSGTLYGMDDRFKCAAMLISGGDVASVIYAKTNFLTREIRADLTAKGLDEAAVRERMKGLDPVTWARPERKDGLMLLAAEKDEVVPLPTVHALAKAYGGAKVVEMPGATHIGAKHVQAHFAQVIEHFRERLLPKKD